ncbi:hypothetical protein MCUN1_001737 [Malassezia cuniculi]|uniref:Uncharacterized protein n=1 Tax=Malassezia cuniculi TaxID=948313 RepID=A0AAF0EQB4_9BASI|nr:hypothetical protein MCUN1_001737 [Malassezia cuniculi]
MTERWTTVAITKSKNLRALAQLLMNSGQTTHISVPKNPTTYTRSLLIETTDEWPSDVTGAILYFFTAVDVLSLGIAELRAFGRSVGVLAPVSLCIVYDGEAETIEHILESNSRLRHLHVVGANPANELAGVAMPIAQLERICAGSTSGQGNIFSRGMGVEYLRYDTRKFAFRPTDIVASRMYAFFQEPTLSYRELLESGIAAKVQHSLDEIGCRRFAALEINWQAAPESSRASESIRAQIDRMSSSEYTGSWPLELRGAWTDQTSGHRSSADVFRAEFVESVTDLYGWEARPAHVPDWMHIDGQYIERITHGFTEHDRLRLEELHSGISERIGTAEFQLEFRVRPPAEFLHLGEQCAALLPEERLALFYARAAQQLL